MKRSGSPFDSHPTSRPRFNPEELEDYRLLTEGIYDFSICSDRTYGKHVRSDKNIDADVDILVESPIICWPLGCSANTWTSVDFCEHCLRFLPNSEDSSTNNPSSINPTTSGIADSLQIPEGGDFCSEQCRSIAMDGGGLGIGWFSIIGGANVLRRLRQSDWEKLQRGDQEIIRSSSPLSNESLARYICEIVRRYCVLKQRIEMEQQVVDESMENQIFTEVISLFERFVTSAFSSGEPVMMPK